jgi:hypothetical protein
MSDRLRRIDTITLKILARTYYGHLVKIEAFIDTGPRMV